MPGALVTECLLFAAKQKFMFVSAWHLYSQELLIFYLLRPFCSSKADYNWVIGCHSHPGRSMHKQCCPHSQDQIPVSELCRGREKFLPQLFEFTDLSVCTTRNSFGLYPDRDFSVILYLNKLSFFPFLFYSCQSTLHLCPPSPTWFDEANSSHTVFGRFKMTLCSLSGLAYETVLTCVFVWFLFVPQKAKSFCSSKHNAGLCCSRAAQDVPALLQLCSQSFSNCPLYSLADLHQFPQM